MWGAIAGREIVGGKPVFDVGKLASLATKKIHFCSHTIVDSTALKYG